MDIQTDDHNVFYQHIWVALSIRLCGGKRLSWMTKCLVVILIVIMLLLLLYPIPVNTSSNSQAMLKQDYESDILQLNSGFPVTPESLLDEASTDEWRRHRQYAIVIDAGSSGSRVMVYSWKSPLYMRQVAELTTDPTQAHHINMNLPLIEPGAKPSLDWQFKEEPGISSFSDRIQDLPSHLKPLLDFANNLVPPRKVASTPIYLLATAGMRLLPQDASQRILDFTCHYVKEHYAFAIHGGCQRHFRVISGELEGIYGWLAVNYLKQGFSNRLVNPQNHLSFGFLDMGGASAQIAFEPTPRMIEKHFNDLTRVTLRAISGDEFDVHVYVTTFLGFGANEARKRYDGALEESKDTLDPCLPPGLTRSLEHASLQGSGDLQQCISHVKPLLNKTLPCPEDPCLFNGVHAPIQDFSNHKFFGVSEYWYSTDDVFGMGGRYSYQDFYQKSKEYCATSWQDIEKRFEAKEYHSVKDKSRLELQCFKSAWLLALLHDGLGIPSNSLSAFQSVNEIGDFSVSWTLGAVLLHASSVIPPKSAGWDISEYPFIVLLVLVVTVAAVWIVRSMVSRVYWQRWKRQLWGDDRYRSVSPHSELMDIRIDASDTSSHPSRPLARDQSSNIIPSTPLNRSSLDSATQSFSPSPARLVLAGVALKRTGSFVSQLDSKDSSKYPIKH